MRCELSIPKDFTDIRTQKPQDVTVLEKYKDWYLCDDAEKRLSRAIDDGAVILVNGFLVKMRGKMTGLALETETVRRGLLRRQRTIVTQGMFYSPINPNARQAIKDAFDQGKTRIVIPEATEWVAIRPLDDPHGDLLKKALQAVQNLPEQNNKLTTVEARIDYREIYREALGDNDYFEDDEDNEWDDDEDFDDDNEDLDDDDWDDDDIDDDFDEEEDE